MNSVFLDSSSLPKIEDTLIKFDLKQNNIRFEFPDGFKQLRLIEECRALNALDVSNPDNFDLLYDIMMQMLVGKVCFIYYIDDKDVKHELARFVVTDRYMNLRGVDAIDEYPILVNWMVEFIAGHLGKKFPRSLQDIRSTMTERKERLKKQKMQEKKENMIIT